MEKQEITETLLDKGFKFVPLFGYDAILTIKNSDGCIIYADVVKRTPVELAQGLKDKFDFYLKDKNGKLISSVNGRNLDDIETIVEEFTERAETLFPAGESKEDEPALEVPTEEPPKKLNVKTIYFDYACETIPVEISYYGALKNDTPLILNLLCKFDESEPSPTTASYFWADEYDEDSEDSFELVSTPAIGTELVKVGDTSYIFNGLELN